MFINNMKYLKNIYFELITDYIKGKIDNYFKFSISNGSLIYWLKVKFLKNLIDKGEEFDSYDLLLDKFKSIPPPHLNYISISSSLVNNFTGLACVTMTSILSSKSINIYICFYLIIPPNFEKINMNFRQNYEFFNITYIKTDNRYNQTYTDSRITKQVYYRFSLGELLSNILKIIYFDSDIILYKDLLNFYNLNFEGKTILGYLTCRNRNKIKSEQNQINTGLLSLNLFEMRKNNIESMFFYRI